MKQPRRAKKSKPVQLAEYAAAYLLIGLVQALPMGLVRRISRLIGDLVFRFDRRRRAIGIDNLRYALGEAMSEAQIEQTVRESCGAFVLTLFEIIKFRRRLADPQRIRELAHQTESIEAVLREVKAINAQAKGCIFVTPHLGNWEVLPYASSYIGVPLAMVARPLDNPYLERLVFQNRTATGQILIPKRNAMFMLERALHRGKSIGLLADQSTARGIAVEFFGRKAMTTPVPAILATAYNRPIVVVACCRSRDAEGFEAFLAPPIWPGDYQSEKAEILRLTAAMNRAMESLIRQRPEQYLWIHNRWKTPGRNREMVLRQSDG